MINQSSLQFILNIPMYQYPYVKNWGCAKTRPHYIAAPSVFSGDVKVECAAFLDFDQTSQISAVTLAENPQDSSNIFLRRHVNTF
jgi:hypothetical protein